jgi:DNA-binding transcriptional ArsR family regulator
MNCPICGASARINQTLLGGYVRAHCAVCGEFTSKILPTRGAARRSDPETSKAAAESIDPSGQHKAILEALGLMRDGTRDEIAAESGLTQYQVGRRLSELAEAGLILPSGTRQGESGRAQTVYIRALVTEGRP